MKLSLFITLKHKESGSALDIGQILHVEAVSYSTIKTASALTCPFNYHLHSFRHIHILNADFNIFP